jgi:hypothetical protein
MTGIPAVLPGTSPLPAKSRLLAAAYRRFLNQNLAVVFQRFNLSAST